ncbi:MAG: carboxypeptidase regulatory-like domain-containing protein [Planctomycetes bacterium]|nr:carboxypeptidase regulatory-like domain-containing protein [Planctomycetota bacterium]
MDLSPFEKELKAIGLPRPRAEVDRRVVERAQADAEEERETNQMIPGSSILPFSPMTLFAAAGAAAAVLAICALAGLFSSGPGAVPAVVPEPAVASGCEGTGLPGAAGETPPPDGTRAGKVEVVREDAPAPERPALPVVEVAAALAGTVTDAATGAAVTGATVECRYRAEEQETSVRATTDEAGRYALNVPRDVPVRLAFSAPGFAPLHRGPMRPGARDWFSGSARLERPEHGLPDGAGAVVGVVRDATTGRPVPEAAVGLCLEDGGSKAACVTDGEGRFRLDWPATTEHRFMIEVRTRGYAEAETSSFAVAAGQTSRFEIFVQPVRTVLRGIVKDAATGVPLIGAKVEVADWPEDSAATTAIATVTGYEIEIGSGLVEIRISAPGYEKQLTSVELSSGETRTLDFALRAIDAGVAGTCVDASNGSVLSGVHIDVFEDSWPAHEADTDPDGRFALHLPAGHYHVLARKDGYGPMGVEKLEITAGGTSELRLGLLPCDASISGRVIERDTGKPVAEIPDLRITAPELGSAERALPEEYPEVDLDGASGAFRTVVAAGTYRIEVRASGYLDQEIEVRVGAREHRYLEVALVRQPPASATVRGIVRIEAGAPLAGAWVLFRYEKTTLTSVQTAADGSFEVKVPAVKLSVHAFGSLTEGTTVTTYGAEIETTPVEGKTTALPITVRVVEPDQAERRG